MFCAILKKPGEMGEAIIDIEFQGEPISGIQRAFLKRPKGRIPKRLARLSTFCWSRTHCYGYIRLESGILYKIDGIDGGTIGGPKTLIYLARTHEPFKIAAYCNCGAAMKGLVKAKDGKAVEKCVELFWKSHQGAGCGPADSKTAAQARRKSEKKAVAE